MHLTGIRKPLLAVSFVSILSLVIAAPQLAFPINSQVPPVAYVSQLYTFAFSATTFVSSAPQISYTIADGPEWLDLESTSRQFSGVPDRSDVGATTLQLVASDLGGQSSTSVTFVVLESPDLNLDAPILPQLERSGPTSSPNSLLAHPQQTFNLSFESGTFSGTTSDTRYYAVSADNTPLPPWVQFDESQLSFSGTAPALVSSLAGRQPYGFRLIASNVPGFAESAIDFNIVISRRVLAFSTTSQTINVSPGVGFQSLPLRSLLTLDGEAVADDQIASINADIPEWVEFDKRQLSLSGTPDTPVNAIITISVTDIYADVVNATIFLQGAGDSNVSVGTIANLNITVGRYFSYTLVTPAFSTSIRAIADLGDASSWLNFDPRSWTLSGQVPLDQPLQILNIPIKFENATSTVTGEIRLHVFQKSQATATPSMHVTETQSVQQVGATSTASEPAMGPNSQNTMKKHVLQVVLAAVFSVVGACLALLLILCCLRRRRRRHKKGETSKASVGEHPEPANGHIQEPPMRPPPSIRNSYRPINAQRTAPSRPPRIDLAWSNDSLQQSRQRLSSAARPRPVSQQRISQIFVASEDQPSQAETPADHEETIACAFEAIPIDKSVLPQAPWQQ